MLYRSLAGLVATLALLSMLVVTTVFAHCDGMDGPVVTSARMALEQDDLNRVLAWVRERDEPEVRSAFRRTLAVRSLGGEAKDLADLYFFETLVRIHRAGEGERTGAGDPRCGSGPRVGRSRAVSADDH
jgi:hypothetical protein